MRGYMRAFEISNDTFWVGGKDWNMRNFHGYETKRGTTYGAYLMLDEKNVLIDTVKADFFPQMKQRIESVIPLDKIDILVANHIEPDHSGGIEKMVEINPSIRIITNQSGLKALDRHYSIQNWNIELVKTGDQIKIGKRSLTFVLAPMVHWPDSMATYIKEDQILFSNDAFGQHIATASLFDDENPLDIIMEEATKYYANIVWPYGGPVKKVMSGIHDLPIKMIATSHGVIWRKYISEILQKYADWSTGKHINKAVIVYDSMWGATEKMAYQVMSTFEKHNIPVTLRNLKHYHLSDVAGEILDAKYIAIGSPTLNNTMLPTVSAFVMYIKGLRPTNKYGYIFGSYGWNNSALKEIESLLSKLNWVFKKPARNVEYRPDQEDLNQITQDVEELIRN